MFSQKLIALCRVQKKRTSKKLCINSQTEYCPSRKKKAEKNRIHEKALRFVYNDRISALKELLTIGRSVTCMTEVYKSLLARCLK